jgi:hypothetical protein
LIAGADYERIKRVLRVQPTGGIVGRCGFDRGSGILHHTSWLYRDFDLQRSMSCLTNGVAQDIGVVLEEQFLEILVWNRKVNGALITTVKDNRAKPGVKALLVDALSNL